MRIRSTKPEFWRSGRVASVSWDARLVLKGLESYVDDNGVGRNELALIVGDLFQRDLIREPSRTLARVSEAISELSEAGLLWLYEADGTDLLYIAFWEEVQRIDHPKSGRLPRPDGTMDYKASAIRESLATSREASRSVAPGTGEQGNRGTGESLLPQQSSKPQTAREPDEPPHPTPAESATPGAQLVREIIPNTIPAAEQTMLRIRASEMLNTGTPPDDIRGGLRIWLDKPHLGAGALAACVSEHVKTRDRPNPTKTPPSKRKVNAALAIAEKFATPTNALETK